MPKFNVSVKHGKGEGSFEACNVRSIKADTAPDSMVFKEWTGDTAWLEDPKSAMTTMIVPFKNVEIEAVFEKSKTP